MIRGTIIDYQYRGFRIYDLQGNDIEISCKSRAGNIVVKTIGVEGDHPERLKHAAHKAELWIEKQINKSETKQFTAHDGEGFADDLT